MTKPHEQEWRAEEWSHPQWVVHKERGLVCNTLHGDDEANAKFIAAAPDMARALLAWMKCGDFQGMAEYEAAEAALRKAGVLP